VISIVAGDNSSGTQGRLQESQHIEIIIRHPGATLRDLVARLRQDKGQLARLIRSLKDQSLLEARTDAGDRRSVPLIQPARAAASIKSFSNKSKSFQKLPSRV
jgi:DNA-binding MarR family transcriptional regulator